MNDEDPNRSSVEHKLKKRKISIGIGILSWISVLVFGACIAVASLLFAILLVEPGVLLVEEQELSVAEAMRFVTMWTCLMVIVIVGTFLIIRPFKARFLRYAKLPLLLGVVPVGLVFVVSLSLSALNSERLQASEDNSTCKTLSDILPSAQASVYSIYRDDGGGGSMVAVDGKGTFITNYHVIEGAKKLTTWNYNSDDELVEVKVKVVDKDTKFDLALVKAPFKTPDYLPLSNDYQDAEDIYTIGFPSNAFDGGSNTITKGIVSRTVDGEYNEGIPDGLTYIQTDAAINPGNSGGAMINKCGLIGVNTLISDTRETDGMLREEGIGYAVSAESIGKAFKLTVY